VISIPNVISGDQAPTLSFRIAPISTESWMVNEHPAEVQAGLMLAFDANASNAAKSELGTNVAMRR